MRLSDLRPAKGSTKKVKRRGRGSGSGHGKTSCRGHKGAKSRSGTTTHIGFEGGQMPIIRSLPKRGFSRNDIKTVCQVVNLDKLAMIDESVIDTKVLLDKGLIRKLTKPVKVLGSGNIKKAVTLKVDACSASAKKKIEQAGGKVNIVSDTN